MSPTRLEREVRILKLYAALSVLAFAVLAFAAFRPRQAQRIPLLEVERINVVEPDGRLALVISNGQRIPGPVLEGRELPRELSAGRRGSAGLMFYSARGDEVGGLTFRGEASGDGYSAGSLLAFDQYRQDQVVAVQYADNGSARSAGVNVWDRSTTVSIHELVELLQAARGPAGAPRDSAERRIEALGASGTLGAHRVFLGSRNRTAVLSIADTRGRPRIRIQVDSLDLPRLEFLDESGRVIQSLPQQARGDGRRP